MANTIHYHARPDLMEVEMSSGRTSIVISTLSISASSLATTDQQRLLSSWIASHDQNVVGSGIVGFDIAEIPWNADTFCSDKKFLLEAIDGVLAKRGWERLGYPPSDDVLTSVAQLRVLISEFSLGDAVRVDQHFWWCGKPTQWVLCEKHAVYLHSQGCVVCHDI